ncbi:hypothetical protein NIES2135_64310 (plasmid) [Leptolyngbya boryana NIES-2135]|uniref:Uncharacterized protein n=2 Tax=Leptolyngbya group TaxID=3081713 RepID=A0A1Z4JS69_LEPBY|nr:MULTISPECIES: hypothetical protein [Leptolyngbya]ULP33780.1 hypothetical protein MCP04_31905 [Leptolyngbya boryana IU 594]BAS60359.1 hypothetical protein LBWT_X4310 [Leptolyngbya boryana IAM M-101]BAS66707.1 hypothetical protein LBDG_X4310 [Leptolyngbya boryana dg5]BAY59554.1 hypothetical protein NIES2135_64310 [Leptolyngbya boryana NIES-2135]
MDEEMLRQQYEQTGNLLDILKNPAVMEEIIRLESEYGEIGAGFPAYSKNPQPVTPNQANAVMRKVRLQSMVLIDLAELIQSVNLGVGTEAAITEGRRRIREHLAHLTDEQQAYFDALVDEDQLQLLDKPLRARLKSVVHLLLSDSDWNAIGQAATNALQNQWNEFIRNSKTA